MTLGARARTATAPPARASPKTSASVARDLAARDWPHGGASHHGIDVGVVPHVEHAGGAGSRGDCENGNGPEKRIEVTRCDHQSDECGEDREQHHARFHQRDEIGQARSQTGRMKAAAGARRE